MKNIYNNIDIYWCGSMYTERERERVRERERERERKHLTLKMFTYMGVCVRRCTCTYLNVHTHTNTKYQLAHTYVKTHICRGQRFSRTMNSHRTFTDSNPEIKKDHICIKTILAIKSGTMDLPSHYQSPEKNINCERNKKNLNTKFRFICEQTFSTVSLDTLLTSFHFTLVMSSSSYTVLKNLSHGWLIYFSVSICGSLQNFFNLHFISSVQ